MTPKEWQPTPETRYYKQKSKRRFVAFCPECGRQVEVNHVKAANQESRYCDECMPCSRLEDSFWGQNHYLEKLQLKAFDRVYCGLSRHDRTPEERMLSLAKAVVTTSDENFNRQVKSPKFRQYLEMEYELMDKRFHNPNTRLRTKRTTRRDMAEIEQLIKLLDEQQQDRGEPVAM